jgi:hypothetical protein
MAMSDGEITAMAILLAGLLAAEAQGYGQDQKLRRKSVKPPPPAPVATAN